MDLVLVSWVAFLGTGVLLFVQSLVDVLFRRRFWFSAAVLVGSATLLVGVGMDALNASKISGGETSMTVAVLAVVGFVAVAFGTTWRFVGQTRS